MRRWLITLFVLAILLVAAVAITVQVVLSTDYPRRLVLGILEDQTGLRIDASSLDTGWGGRTALRNLSIALPLDADPFITVPSLEISHTDLIRIVVTQQLTINVAHVNQPEVYLRQDDNGRWNLLEAAEIVEQRQAALASEPGEIPPLPKLDVVDARIAIADMTGRHVEYGPITLQGEPIDTLAWSFALRFGDDVLAHGSLAPLANWAHQIHFDFQDIHHLIAPWLDETPPVLQAAGEWRGQIDGTTLNGALRFKPLRADTLTLTGETVLSVDGPTISARPNGIVLAFDDPDLPVARVKGGRATVSLAEQSISVNRVVVNALEMAAQIDGGWVLDDDSAWARVKWSGTIDELQARHEGTINARLDMPRVGWHVLNATIDSQGSTPDAHWNTRWEVIGRGERWDAISGSITSPYLTIVTEQDEFDLRGFKARYTSTWPTIKLTHLDLPGANTNGRGQYDAESGEWFLHMTARDWRTPVTSTGPLNVSLQMAGSPEQIYVDVLEVSSNGAVDVPAFQFSAGGVYSLHELQPLDLRARLLTTIDEADAHADLEADFSVTGILQPLDLNIAGDLIATACSWEQRHIEDMRIPLRGVVRATHATFESPGFDLFGGTWQLDGRYDRATNFASAVLRGEGSSIQRIIALADAPIDLTGTFSAHVNLELPQLDPDHVHVHGNWELADLFGEGLHAAHGRGRVDFRDELVRMDEMELTQNSGSLTGWAELHLERSNELVADISVNDWHVGLEQHALDAWLNGRASIELNYVDLTASPGSELELQLNVSLEGEPVGSMHFGALLDGRTVTVRELAMEGFAGVAEGTGVLHLTKDRWKQSTLDVSWQDLDLAMIPLRLNELHELAGTSSGTLRMAVAEDPRAPEPMQIDLDMRFVDAAYGPATIEHSTLTGFLGPDRLMVNDSSFAIMNGTLSFWGRVTQHEGEPFVHGHIQLLDIDLQQFADFVDLTDGPMPGRINGSGSAGGYLRPKHRLFGQAQLQLTESDIASAPGISQLYDILNVDFGRPLPTGRGDVLVRLEGDALDIVRLTYFNRGIDVVARIRIEDIWQGPQSPITGLAGGAIRPLRDTRLPFIGDNLDRLLSALQADAATVRIGGTLENEIVTVVPLSEVTGALGRIIRGTPD